jgi:hypothetical protein
MASCSGATRAGRSRGSDETAASAKLAGFISALVSALVSGFTSGFVSTLVSILGASSASGFSARSDGVSTPGSDFGSAFASAFGSGAAGEGAAACGSSASGMSAGRGNETVLTLPGTSSRFGAGCGCSRRRETSRSPLSVRLTDGKSRRGRYSCIGMPESNWIEPVTTGSPPTLASRASGGSGITVPTGCGKLKVAAWIVPNGDAIMWARARCDTSGCRAISAARS